MAGNINGEHPLDVANVLLPVKQNLVEKRLGIPTLNILRVISDLVKKSLGMKRLIKFGNKILCVIKKNLVNKFLLKTVNIALETASRWEKPLMPRASISNAKQSKIMDACTTAAPVLRNNVLLVINIVKKCLECFIT